MPRSRSRSRSPKRAERRRSRSRERKHRNRRSRSRSPRHRSRSPVYRRSPSRRSKERDLSKGAQADKKSLSIERPKIDESQLVGLTEEEKDMMKLMGFANFDSTKGKKVEGNDIYSANIMRKRRYRQYMNRRGGFNRPLDFIA